ncbi:hypothetical protein B0H14DRAFT_2634820 [Mycena olivaceomarginata]|nr:hypothetical protein B0H14DRAFT_2634820 [Mycena olivaceomarginata]
MFNLKYKKLAALKSEKKAETPAQRKQIEQEVPANGNDCISSVDWTDAENVKLYDALKGYAHWEVNYVKKFVRSTSCDGLTSNIDGVCDACMTLAKDASLIHAVNRKNKKRSFPEEEPARLMTRTSPTSRKSLLPPDEDELDGVDFEALEAHATGKYKADVSTTATYINSCRSLDPATTTVFTLL